MVLVEKEAVVVDEFGIDADVTFRTDGSQFWVYVDQSIDVNAKDYSVAKLIEVLASYQKNLVEPEISASMESDINWVYLVVKGWSPVLTPEEKAVAENLDWGFAK